MKWPLNNYKKPWKCGEVSVSKGKPNYVSVLRRIRKAFLCGILVHTEKGERNTKSQQLDEPLAFLRRQFCKSQLDWKPFEMEAFAIVKVFQRMILNFDWLTQLPSLLIITTC